MKPAMASALLLLAWLPGCTDNGVGRKCIIPPQDGGVSITSPELSSPALECVSRLCLIEPPTGTNPPRSTCTIRCATDADCVQAVMGNSSDGFCGSNFVCAVATVQGAFKCKTVCVCRDDLVCGANGDADGGVITPAACGNPSPPPAC
jgi:hypothetical protein